MSEAKISDEEAMDAIAFFLEHQGREKAVRFYRQGLREYAEPLVKALREAIAISESGMNGEQVQSWRELIRRVEGPVTARKVNKGRKVKR